MMMHSFTFVVLGIVLSTAVGQKKLMACYKSQCFRLHLESKTQEDADLECREEYNGNLAVVTDQLLWAKVKDDILGYDKEKNKFMEHVLLGIKVSRWSTKGETMKGHEVDLKGISMDRYNDRCLFAMQHHNWRWDLVSCNEAAPFLCEFTVKPCSLSDVSIPNAEYNLCLTDSNMYHTETLDIQCWNGFQLEGPKSITCLNGKWTQFPNCSPGCAPPNPRPNAQLIGTSNATYSIGKTVTFVCNDKHVIWKSTIKTHFTSTCQKDGDWSELDDGCIAIETRETEVVVINENFDDDIVLNCPLIDSQSGSTIHWMKNDELLPVSSQYDHTDGSLTIYNASMADVGLYFCLSKLNHVVQIGMTFYNLAVKENCNLYGDNPKTQVHYTNEGDSGILGCHGTKEGRHVKWYKNGIAITSSKERNILPNGALFLKNLQLSDIGIYCCQIERENSSGCKINVTHKVSVLVATQTVCGISGGTIQQPWVVTLWNEDEVIPFCYGTIIDRQWIVTTAFCLSNFRRKKNLGLSVELGRGTSNRVTTSVVLVKIHPNYRHRLHGNDIGLGKLQGPVLNFSMDILPMCLSEMDLTQKHACQKSVLLNGTVSGWGTLETDDADDLLLAVEQMALVDKDLCQAAGKFGFADDMFCARGINQQSSTASDSGSPFMLQWKEKLYLAGIYSWGGRATNMDMYDYFVNVAKHYDWIKGVIST